MYFTPQQAPLVTLLFLGSVFLLGVAGLAFVAALASGRMKIAKLVFAGAVAYALLYGGALWAFSATSKEALLQAGQTKYFCEIDCHVAYSISGVTTAKTLGEGERAVTANGKFYVVTLRSWFDQKTISARRGTEPPLWPNPRELSVLDAGGKRYLTSLAGQKAAVGSTVPLTQPLRPGESYESTLVFDLPEGVQQPRLLVADWFPLSVFVIGHENSFGHKKAYFALEATAGVQAQR